jgi:hypothetical protein
MPNRIETTGRFAIAAAAALAMIALAACSSVEESPLSPSATDTKDSQGIATTGMIQLALASEPAAFDDFIFVIRGVSARRASGDSLDDWYEMATKPAEYAMQDLGPGVASLLAEAPLPGGTYDMFRILLDKGSRVVQDGHEYEVFIPSGTTRGLQVPFEFELLPGETFTCTIDFEVPRSVRVDRQGRYHLKPILRAGLGEPAEEEPAAGSIRGVIQPVSAEPVVMAFVGADTLTVQADPFSGAFELQDLPAGTYDLRFEPTAAGMWFGVSREGVEVQPGQETDLGTVFLLFPQ